MVGKTPPFVQDGASRHHEGYFSGLIDDVNQNSDEDDASAGKPTGRGQWKAGTGGTNNQRETEARVELETVLDPGLELAGREGFDLTLETESVLRNALLVTEDSGTESFLVTLPLGLADLVLFQ